MASDERKKWRGRLLMTGEGTFRPVDADERPDPQVTQGLAALRRGQRPTLRREGARFGRPATASGSAEVHTLPQRRGEPDTAPGRPPGNPPEPTTQQDPDVPRIDLGWGTAPAEAEAPAAAPEPVDELLTVRRSELERMVADAVRAQLGPIATAISDMRSHMAGAPADPEPVVEASVPRDAEPIALLALMDDAPPVEPVVALTIPEDYDWTKGKAETFAPAPAQAQG